MLAQVVTQLLNCQILNSSVNFQLAPHARMTSLTASMFNQSQAYRPSQSSETDLHRSDLRPVQISMPANNVPSTSQVTSQMINQVANELVRQFHTNPQFDSGRFLSSRYDLFSVQNKALSNEYFTPWSI